MLDCLEGLVVGIAEVASECGQDFSDTRARYLAADGLEVEDGQEEPDL